MGLSYAAPCDGSVGYGAAALSVVLVFVGVPAVGRYAVGRCCVRRPSGFCCACRIVPVPVRLREGVRNVPAVAGGWPDMRPGRSGRSDRRGLWDCRVLCLVTVLLVACGCAVCRACDRRVPAVGRYTEGPCCVRRPSGLVACADYADCVRLSVVLVFAGVPAVGRYAVGCCCV